VTLALREIHVGDCRELLARMADESVNCVVTSPPYWGLRDYGVDGQLGLEATPDEYVEMMVAVFREVRRVLRSDGTLWLNLGDCYATGAGKVDECPGGGKQGARWVGDVDRLRDDKRGYRGERLANGRGDSPAVLRVKTRALRDGSHAGKHAAMTAKGPMSQPNRMPIPGLKPKDLVGIPWRVAFALQADGWWLRKDIVWSKPNPMPESTKDRPTTAHEYVFLMTKSEIYAYNADAIKEPVTGGAHRRGAGVNPKAKNEQTGDRRKDGFNERWRVKQNASFSGAVNELVEDRNKRSVWTIATEPYPGSHFATFPRKLVEPCILAGCPAGGVVLDPFGGSGTVGEVAEVLGRNWILLELSPEYAELARKRVAQRGLFVKVAV
jgi:site-specific DNA-methyltransferase (cytosine-N4-specific)